MGAVKLFLTTDHRLQLNGDVNGLGDRDVEVWCSDNATHEREGILLAIVKVKDLPIQLEATFPRRYVKFVLAPQEHYYRPSR